MSSTKPYRLVCVDRQCTVLGELSDAVLDHVTWDLNGPGEVVYHMNQTSSNITVPLEHINEVQVWIRGKLMQWAFHQDTTEKTKTCDFTCPGLPGYAGARIISNGSLSYGIDANHMPVGSGVEQMDIAADVWLRKVSDFNIGVAPYTPSGLNRYLFFDRWEHRKILDDILSMFPNFQDALGNYTGFDWDVQWAADGSSRYFKMFYPSRGATKNDIVLEYGKNITDYTVSVSGKNQVNSVYFSGGSNGDIRFENYAEDAASIATYGRWEAVQNQGSENDVNTLLALAQRYVNLHKFPLKMPEITVVEVPDKLLGLIEPGDRIPIKIINGRTQINGTFRIGSMTWKPGAGNLDLVLIDPSEQPDPIVPGSFRAVNSAWTFNSYDSVTTFANLEGI